MFQASRVLSSQASQHLHQHGSSIEHGKKLARYAKEAFNAANRLVYHVNRSPTATPIIEEMATQQLKSARSVKYYTEKQNTRLLDECFCAMSAPEKSKKRSL